jgi:type IV pilus assembly protein PilN
MIRINLLHEKKVKRAEKGHQSLLAGVAGILVAGAAVYLFVHAPKALEAEEAAKVNSRVEKKIRELKADTSEFDTVTAQIKLAQEQSDAIVRLNDARAVPAWMLHEMASILTKDHKPIMSPEMAERVKSDHNRQWTQSWDPKRVWIDSFEEKGGVFALKGGAQSDTDVTQLALRLQASVFFREVVPEGLDTAEDQAAKVAFYRFTITGKVVY